MFFKSEMKLFFSLLLAFFVATNCSKKGDDEEEDVYTSTDPKKREPTPCEGKLINLL